MEKTFPGRSFKTYLKYRIIRSSVVVSCIVYTNGYIRHLLLGETMFSSRSLAGLTTSTARGFLLHTTQSTDQQPMLQKK